MTSGSPLITMSIPLRDGRELRLRCKGDTCALEQWSTYPHGHAMMAGGFDLDAQDLRLLLHTARCALWALERREAA